MPYDLIYHPRVKEEDLPPIPLNVQRRISHALESRVASAPEHHGEPLKGTLKGYWKLRLGDYRIVYRISGSEVWTFGIIHRKQVYEDIRRRLRWHPT